MLKIFSLYILLFNMSISHLSNEELLKTYQPVLYLHEKEEISPMSFENYIKDCELYSNDKLLLKTHTITLPLNKTFNNCSNKQLNYKGIYVKPQQNVINSIPIYGKVIKNSEYIDIIYMFFYPYNKGYKIFKFFNVGQHQADLEYVIVRVNIKSKLIDKIYYSAHSDEDQIYNYNDINFIVDRITPIIYVAKNSHANYNKPKTYCRIFGFVNDITTHENSIVWKSKNIIDLDKNKYILSYDGKLGFNAVDSFNRRKFLNNNMFVNHKNPTCCFRFCLPFSYLE